MKRLYLTYILIAAAIPAFAGVTVSSPTNGATLGSTVQFVATATTTTCSKGVASMGVYVDNALKYVVNGTSLNTSLTIASGAHHTVVEEWDYCGGATYTPIDINVAAAQSGVWVTSPGVNATVGSPVNYVATATTATCSKGVASMGIYVNNQLQTQTVVSGASMNTTLSLAAGKYDTVVEEWDFCGGAAYTHVPITVAGSAALPGQTFSHLENSANWQGEHDAGTPGSSSGTSGLVSNPSRDGSARQFAMNYSGNAGQRWHLSFGNDPGATQFVYDLWVNLPNPASVANLELDINHVMANGVTVILGTQCSYYSGTWEYSVNANGHPSWRPSNIPCNPRTWTPNAWNHIQIGEHHDSSGNGTRDFIIFNGVRSDFIGATGNSSFALGWAPGSLLTNFQVDAIGSGGSLAVYADEMTVVAD
jgi:hypothetical protein